MEPRDHPTRKDLKTSLRLVVEMMTMICSRQELAWLLPEDASLMVVTDRVAPRHIRTIVQLR